MEAPVKQRLTLVPLAVEVGLEPRKALRQPGLAQSYRCADESGKQSAGKPDPCDSHSALDPSSPSRGEALHPEPRRVNRSGDAARARER